MAQVENKKVLICAHGNSLRALVKHLDGISDGESRRIPEWGGSSINWVVGHILSARNLIFGLLDVEGGLLGERRPRDAAGARA